MEDRSPPLFDFADRPYPHGVRSFIASRNPDMPPEILDQRVLAIKVKVDTILKAAEEKGQDLFTELGLPPDSPDRDASIRWALEWMFIYEQGL